jgi:hypothetical protein
VVGYYIETHKDIPRSKIPREFELIQSSFNTKRFRTQVFMIKVHCIITIAIGIEQIRRQAEKCCKRCKDCTNGNIRRTFQNGRGTRYLAFKLSHLFNTSLY